MGEDAGAAHGVSAGPRIRQNITDKKGEDIAGGYPLLFYLYFLSLQNIWDSGL